MLDFLTRQATILAKRFPESETMSRLLQQMKNDRIPDSDKNALLVRFVKNMLATCQTPPCGICTNSVDSNKLVGSYECRGRPARRRIGH